MLWVSPAVTVEVQQAAGLIGMRSEEAILDYSVGDGVLTGDEALEQLVPDAQFGAQPVVPG